MSRLETHHLRADLTCTPISSRQNFGAANPPRARQKFSISSSINEFGCAHKFWPTKMCAPKKFRYHIGYHIFDTIFSIFCHWTDRRSKSNQTPKHQIVVFFTLPTSSYTKSHSNHHERHPNSSYPPSIPICRVEPSDYIY